MIVGHKTWKIIGIIMAVIGVTGYRELPQWYHLLMWIPISFGYGMYYDEKFQEALTMLTIKSKR